MPGQSGVTGTGLAVLFTGGILLWSGLHGKKATSVLRNIIAGKDPGTAASTPSLAGSGIAGGDVAAGLPGEIAASVAGTVGAPGASASAAQAIAKVLAAPYGWSTGQQWTDLVWLWNAESGWNRLVTNGHRPYDPTYVAYGIPQALPASKMGKLANPPVSSATAQIAWGLAYIKNRYGSPSGARAFHEANGFY
jgi:hypothetical protein